MLKRVHHIAYVVKDLEASINRYENIFGVKIYKRQNFEKAGIEVALFKVGDIIFELIKPLKKGSRSETFYRENGEGFFHIAFEVEDIDQELGSLEKKGIQLFDQKPIDGLDWKVAQLDKNSTCGVVTQLVETKSSND